MSNYIKLTKILLKNSFGKSLTSNATKKKRSGWILYTVLALSMLPLITMFYSIANLFYDGLVMLGQQGLVLVLGFWVTSIMVFFFGIFYVINVFYFSKDIENLLPLPLKSSQIIAAKFTVTLIFEYFTEAVILMPILISFGIKSGGGIAYIIFSLFIFLTLPIIPLIYSSLINMIVMRFTNIGKRKDLFRMIGGVFALTLGIGVNIFIQKFVGKGISPDKIQDMIMSGNNSLVSISNSIFPSNKYAVLSLINAGTLDSVINIFIYIALLATFTIVFLIFGEVLYLKGVVGVSEVFSKRIKMSAEQYDKTVVQKPIVKTYMAKEIKLLFRTPIYFMNCILMNFIWPIFFVIPMIANPGDSQGFSEIFIMMNKPEYADITLVVIFGISIFISSTNAITSTSISREGQNIYFNKFVPVSYKNQIIAKVLSGFIISILGTVGVFFVIGFVLKISINLLIMGIVLSVVAVSFTSMLGILIDLRSPKLDWDSEQKAVKQNFNSIINMMVCAGLAAIIIIPLMVYRTNEFIVFIALTVIYAIFNLVIYRVLMTKGIKYFEEIEG